ncbi:hypothetical protein APSETT444_002027 [Aspergillus pseudonomiae]
MVLPSVMFYFGGVYLALDILRVLGFKAPFRISSTPKGSTMPTALYVMIEDVVAVDGGGGQKFRYALRVRYLSSPYFRLKLEMTFQMPSYNDQGVSRIDCQPYPKATDGSVGHDDAADGA